MVEACLITEGSLVNGQTRRVKMHTHLFKRVPRKPTCLSGLGCVRPDARERPDFDPSSQDEGLERYPCYPVQEQYVYIAAKHIGSGEHIDVQPHECQGTFSPNRHGCLAPNKEEVAERKTLKRGASWLVGFPSNVCWIARITRLQPARAFCCTSRFCTLALRPNATSS